MQEEVVHVGLFVDKLNYESIQSFSYDSKPPAGQPSMAGPAGGVQGQSVLFHQIL